MIMPAKNIYD